MENWSRYAELIRLCIPYNQVASLDVVPDCMPRPPAEKGSVQKSRIEIGVLNENKKKHEAINRHHQVEVLHLLLVDVESKLEESSPRVGGTVIYHS